MTLLAVPSQLPLPTSALQSRTVDIFAHYLWQQECIDLNLNRCLLRVCDSI